MTNSTRRKQQRGLTLVELMIAMTVGSILMLGVVQLFSNMRNAYTLNESLSRIQEAGRFSMAHMSSRMRMAGFMGCDRVPPSLEYHNFSPSEQSSLMLAFNVPISGYDYSGTGRNGAGFTLDSLDPAGETDTNQWTPALDAELQGDVVPGSDVLVVRYMEPDGVNAMQPGSNGASSPPTFDGDNDFSGGDVVLISDCSGRAVVGEVKSNSPSQITFGAGQIPQLGNPVTINRARSDVFYVGDTADGPPALFWRRFMGRGSSGGGSGGSGKGGGPGGGGSGGGGSGGSTNNIETQELVRGVESMQLVYGVDTDGNGRTDQYMDAGEVDAADDWGNVLTARVSLLIRGHRDIGGLPERNEINVLGVPFTLAAGEDRQRRVFTTTVQFRNRARN